MALPETTDDSAPVMQKNIIEPGTIENIFAMKQKLTRTEALVYIQYLTGALLSNGYGTDKEIH